MKTIIALAAVALCATAALAQTPDEAAIKQLDGFFATIDRNHDGRLSQAEMTAYGASQGYGTVMRRKAWKRLDADRNGYVSKDEFVRDAIAFRKEHPRR